MNKYRILLLALFLFVSSFETIAQDIVTQYFEPVDSKEEKLSADDIFASSALYNSISELANPAQQTQYLNQSRIYSADNLFSSPKNSILTDNLFQSPIKNSTMITNRRLKYSSLWAFASLNYLYADLVGLMDLNLLSQYQTGIVNGIEITPGFLTGAAAYMQIPLANVFLPLVIKNDKVLRWVQIISGSIATLAQGATLFVGKPQPYYLLFSAIEMGATAFITYDAIKWKPESNRKKKPIDF